ncbi:MAG TPA: DUF5829 family protein [Myxococcales bacterium]|nr:DUF5829 family protein [Myxococcales bacterium]
MTPLLLNHFYVTPDQETFEAAASSDLLSRFGALEKRTTVRKDATYTGLYLYGERTYLELLHPGSTPFGARTGIAYGVEEEGGLEEIGREMAPARIDLVFRGEVPWFRRCRSLQSLEGLTEWTMEYEPAFFRGFHPDLPPERPAIARADALTRYAAACGKLRQRDDGLFEDVVALEVALAPNDLARWKARTLRVQDAALGMTAAAGSPTGILAAHLRLRRDAGRSVERIGRSTLSLDGKNAVWQFEKGFHGQLS